MIEKNQFFYEFQKELDRECEKPRIKKQRIALIIYFQEHWQMAINKISGADLLKEAINEVCLSKKQYNKKGGKDCSE